MAMNKAERAEMENLKQQLAIERAWRRTQQVQPDVMPPSSFSGLSVGWVSCGADYQPFVSEACSSSVFHSVGRTDKTTTQRAICMYSTKILALKQSRYRLEQYAATKLAEIDAMIEEEMSK